MLKVTNIRIPVGESEEGLSDACAQALRIPSTAVRHLRILRKSLDVRNKRRLEHVYTAAVSIDSEISLPSPAPGIGIQRFEEQTLEPPIPGNEGLHHRPVIVGAGPAGLLAAYVLAEAGYRPLILERGKSVKERTADVRAFESGASLDAESNFLFGEGGAGTFSDGKLTCRRTGPETDRVLEILAECKGKPSIVYDARPHLGSNRLPAVVKALRRRILEMGGEIWFSCRVDQLELRGPRVAALETTRGRIESDVVILAIGHSARDTIAMLHGLGVPIEFKPFQMGIRIEQPQERVTRFQFGDSWQAQLLGPADYITNVRVGDREIFSFCMCAGGYVMPSVSQHGYFCTNGMSRSFHESPFANSGIVVTISSQDLDASPHPLSGIEYQAKIEHAAFELTGGTYEAPIQWARDFIETRRSRGSLPSSYRRGVRPENLWTILPERVSKWLADGLAGMDHQWRGEFLKDATVVGPEARGSCPIRISRDPLTRESPRIHGLYPIGEGAGYAGGIVSAAVDGLRTARTVISRFRPPNR